MQLLYTGLLSRGYCGKQVLLWSSLTRQKGLHLSYCYRWMWRSPSHWYNVRTTYVAKIISVTEKSKILFSAALAIASMCNLRTDLRRCWTTLRTSPAVQVKRIYTRTCVQKNASHRTGQSCSHIYSYLCHSSTTRAENEGEDSTRAGDHHATEIMRRG